MFEKVLYATDFSGYAEKITECMGEIPGVKELILLHVVDPKKLGFWQESRDALVEKARLLLEEKKRFFEAAGKTVKAIVTVGIPSKEILRVADDECVSLIVIGARGMGMLHGLLVGSVSMEVLRYGTVSTLLMRYKVVEKLGGSVFEKYCERTFSRVLYPVDPWADPETVLSLVSEMPPADRVVLVSIVAGGETKGEIETGVKRVTQTLSALCDRLKSHGYEAVFHVHAGNPATEISRVAAEEDVSLIVVDARGETGPGRVQVANTTENVIRATGRPVLVIR
ncbi:MAG: Universal stress protein [Methanocella sp. PtaU1.Bin125]|nr:MAG: Universal stress protein [Methanocella sp. PtaU1.Bin125]